MFGRDIAEPTARLSGLMFVVCGEALWDFYAAEAGGGLAFDARMGGSPFNVAIGLARLEQDAALFTKLSTDRLGERLHDALRREGVSDLALARTARLTTISLVDVGPDGSCAPRGCGWMPFATNWPYP